MAGEAASGAIISFSCALSRHVGRPPPASHADTFMKTQNERISAFAEGLTVGTWASDPEQRRGGGERNHCVVVISSFLKDPHPSSSSSPEKSSFIFLPLLNSGLQQKNFLAFLAFLSLFFAFQTFSLLEALRRRGHAKLTTPE